MERATDGVASVDDGSSEGRIIVVHGIPDRVSSS